MHTYIYTNHWLPDGVGTNGVFTEGPHIRYSLQYDVYMLRHIWLDFAKCCRLFLFFATFCLHFFTESLILQILKPRT